MRKIGLISWLSNKLGGTVPLSGAVIDEVMEQYFNEIHIREVAFWSTVNIIANAVSKCEFKTFTNGKETKGSEYYLWNVSPNVNQNSSAFIHKWISQLYRNNECLIIEQNGQLFVADNFVKTPYALYDDVFTQVTVKNFTFNRSFKQSEVLYFELSEKDMRKVTNALYDSYLKLISYTMTAYQKSRGTKGIFKYDTLPVAGTEQRAMFDALINGKISNWLHSDIAALPLGVGQEWKELTQKTYASETTRDIRAMIDDIVDFTEKAFGVHKDVDKLLTFCIDPLCDMLQEEINRKRVGKTDYIKGTKLVIDTKVIKHVDLLSVSTAIDKLVSSGCFCVNDIRRLVGDEPIDEEWANQYFMTKNYSTIEELINSMQGGENNKENMGT